MKKGHHFDSSNITKMAIKQQSKQSTCGYFIKNRFARTTCMLSSTVRKFVDKNTPGRRQSKTLFIIDERGSKIARNSVFDCHLSPIGRQIAIENSISNDF